MASDKDQKTAARIFDRIKLSIEHKSNRENIWTQAYDTYRNKQISVKETKLQADSDTDVRDTSRSNAQAAYAKTQVEVQAGHEYKNLFLNRPYFEMRSASPEVSPDRANKATRALSRLCTIMKYASRHIDVINSKPIFGEIGTFVYPDYKTVVRQGFREITAPDAEGAERPVMKEDGNPEMEYYTKRERIFVPKIEVVHPCCYGFECGVQNSDDATWEYKISYNTLDQIKSWKGRPGFRNITEALKVAGSDSESKAEDMVARIYQSASTSFKNSPRGRVFHYWEDKLIETEEGAWEFRSWYYRLVGRVDAAVLVYEGPNPNDHEKSGLNYYHQSKDVLTPDGLSPFSYTESIHRAKTMAMRLTIDYMNRALKPLTLRRRGANIKPRQLMSRLGGIVDVYNVDKDVRQLPPQQIGFDPVALQEYFDRQADQMFGTVEMQRGIPAGSYERTARGIHQLAERSDARSLPRYASHTLNMHEEARLIWSLAMQHGDDLLAFEDEERDVIGRLPKSELSGEYDFKVLNTTSESVQSEAVLQMVFQLLDPFIQERLLNPEPLIKAVLRFANFDDVKIRKEQLELWLGQAMAGQQPPVPTEGMPSLPPGMPAGAGMPV